MTDSCATGSEKLVPFSRAGECDLARAVSAPAASRPLTGATRLNRLKPNMGMNVRRSAYSLAIASALTGLCALVQAQTPKAFEVAAIRPLDASSGPESSGLPTGRHVRPLRFEL